MGRVYVGIVSVTRMQPFKTSARQRNGTARPVARILPASDGRSRGGTLRASSGPAHQVPCHPDSTRIAAGRRRSIRAWDIKSTGACARPEGRDETSTINRQTSGAEGSRDRSCGPVEWSCPLSAVSSQLSARSVLVEPELTADRAMEFTRDSGEFRIRTGLELVLE
jgi:hypothetical protein